MSTPPQGSAQPVEVPLGLRRPIIIAGVVAVAGLIAAIVLGHPLMGVLGCVGVGLGVLNIALVKNAVGKITADSDPSKQKMALSSAGRLALITAFAVVIGFLLRPDGFGVFAGLAVFQIILVLNTSLPVLKGLRQQS